MSNLLDNIKTIPAEIFSPFKTFLIGFFVLVALGKLNPELCTFLTIAFILTLLEILHNDYLRIVLNNKAEKGKDNP